MELRTNMHTIYLLVGPTEAGKSTFAKNILIPQLYHQNAEKGFKTNIQYLASDEIREELLGDTFHKHDSIMLESSEQAFHILFEKLKAVTSFPINADFVIMDTIGLSEEFREKVMAVAKENHYNIEAIIFDYKKREDYYSSNCSKRIITNHVTRLKQEAMKQISRSKYNRVHKIREKNFYDYEKNIPNPAYKVIIEDLDFYMSHILDKDKKYIIVGDVHEKIEELKRLIISHGFHIENNKILSSENMQNYKIILIGDFIDKGGNTKETIEFIYENTDWFYFVKGNHENFVYKYLNGKIDQKSIDGNLINDYFDSIKILEQDEELKRKFEKLVELSREFYKYIGRETASFYITHAPCKKKYIGKVDNYSLREQRRFAIDREQPFEEQLNFLEKEAVGNHPYHVFGHVAVKKSIRIKNKIGIDTGCVHGNELTSVMLDSWKPFYRHQQALGQTIQEELPILFGKKKLDVNMRDLETSELKRLHYCMENKINFISGTMSPADKDKDANELESLRQGLLYFKNHGIEEVVLQPKYMGSRCNIYLSIELAQCYAVSRNGYKVKQIDLTNIYKKLLAKFSQYMKNNKIKMLVLDGELLPWSALGKGLIERQFQTIDKALDKELSFLKKFDFEEQFNELKGRYEATDYPKDQETMSKKNLVKKYGNANYQVFKPLTEVLKTYVDLDTHINAQQKFHEQIELYSQETELEFMPFQLLKEIHQSGEEVLPKKRTSEIFKFIAEDVYKMINFKDENWFEEAMTFFTSLTTEKKMEGVVIKPEVVKPNVAPYLKVRNADYLTIVYGYDYRFPHKFAKLMKQKSIKKKLKTSINEYQLGQEMLSHKNSEINHDNKSYKQVVSNMLFEVMNEKEIDPRL